MEGSVLAHFCKLVKFVCSWKLSILYWIPGILAAAFLLATSAGCKKAGNATLIWLGWAWSWRQVVFVPCRCQWMVRGMCTLHLLIPFVFYVWCFYLELRGGGVCVCIDAKCSLIMEESWATILPCLMSCTILFKLMGTHCLEGHGMETAEGCNVLVFISDAWSFRCMLLCLAIYQNYILFFFFC